MTRLALSALLLLAAGCIPEEGPLMEPGSDCLECHGGGAGSPGGGLDSGGEEEDGPAWTVAGTVFSSENAPVSAGVRGVKIHLTDANGRRVTIRSNQAGNFYLADGLAFPLRAAVERGGRTVEMEAEVTYGGCNACHDVPPREDASGRIAAP